MSGSSSHFRPAAFALTAPLLVGGFVASALANRMVFAGWALVAAAASVLVLRSAFELVPPDGLRGGRGGAAAVRVAGRAAAVLAPAVLLFALLVARHREDLDLGLRAVWPGLYTPAASAPGTYVAAAAALALVAVLAAALPAARSRRQRNPSGASAKHGENDG